MMSYNAIFKLLAFKEKSIVSRKSISRKTFAVPFVTWLYENIFVDAYLLPPREYMPPYISNQVTEGLTLKMVCKLS